MIVAAIEAGSYEERTCLRCYEGRVYDMQRGAWVACEQCSGTARWWSTSTLSRSAVHASAASDPLRGGVLAMGLRLSCVAGRGWVAEIAVVLLGAHTTSKNPHPVSRIQAYIAKSGHFPTCVRCIMRLSCGHYRVYGRG